MTKPRGPKRWSKLTKRQQYRLRYRRAKWRSELPTYAASAELFRIRRDREGISQAEMAQKVGVSLRSYKRYESGQSMPRGK